MTTSNSNEIIEKNIIHKNSCGEPIYNDKKEVQINCGDDLGGNKGEFYQCYECRIKDFYDAGFEAGKREATKEKEGKK